MPLISIPAEPFFFILSPHLLIPYLPHGNVSTARRRHHPLRRDPSPQEPLGDHQGLFAVQNCLLHLSLPPSVPTSHLEFEPPRKTKAVAVCAPGVQQQALGVVSCPSSEGTRRRRPLSSRDTPSLTQVTQRLQQGLRPPTPGRDGPDASQLHQVAAIQICAHEEVAAGDLPYAFLFLPRVIC